MTKETQYNDIAEAYTKNEEGRISKKYAFAPSFFRVLGDVKNKKILDVACGDGYLTRKIKDKGGNVTGCDISSEMIKIAEKKEKEKLQGIKYFVIDVSKLEKIDDFDVVTAGFLLHYASSKEILKKMCENIFKNLKEEGRFVSINHNPEYPLKLTKEYKYSHVPKKEKDLEEGDELTANLYNREGDRICSFDYYFWGKETYESALKKVGFKNIKWHQIKVSKEGIDKYGEEFWKDFYKYPTLIILEAEK